MKALGALTREAGTPPLTVASDILAAMFCCWPRHRRQGNVPATAEVGTLPMVGAWHMKSFPGVLELPSGEA